jgi:hypothetical protein
MRLGQHLRVRKYDNGGDVDISGQSTDTGANVTNCTNAGGNWTGFTCDMSTASGGALTSVQDVGGSQFSQLSGLTQDPQAMANYLRDEYGLQDAGDYLKSFEAYDPGKEHQLRDSYRMGMDQAQTGARQQMGDMYSKARQAGAKGGGFGGRGKTLSAMKGKTLGGLEQQQAKMGKSFTQGVQGLREDYADDWLGQIGKLSQRGAAFCKPDEQYVEDTTQTKLDDGTYPKICKKV